MARRALMLPAGRRLVSGLLLIMALLCVRALIVEPYLVVSDSMEETLVDGDLVLVDKRGFGTALPSDEGGRPIRRGNPVLHFLPGGDPEVRVKRVVGLPGDILEMRAGILFRNGRRLAEPYARLSPWPVDLAPPSMDWQRTYLVKTASRWRTGAHARPEGPDDWGPILLPTDRYFVLGDNRRRSVDSRQLGPVRGVDLIGRPFLIVYSYGRQTGTSLPWLQAVRTARIGSVRDRP